ncbi:MAG: SpoIVB peptidase [Dethiobacteraceae bacterium]|nr:SpoIVB peptidase [Bacillota bacterium]
MKRRWRRQRFALLLLGFLLLLAAVFPWRIWLAMQNEVRLLEGCQYYVNIASPLSIHVKGDKAGILTLNGSPVSAQSCKYNLSSPLQFSAQNLGSVNLEFKLFGVIPLRQLTVNVLPEKKLIPGGHSIGIKLHSEGVLVVGHHLVQGRGVSASPAKEAGIEVGDVLLAIEGTKLADANQVAEVINQHKDKSILTFQVKRGERIFTAAVKPLLCQETNRPRVGLYVRDSAAGVGTLTFYDPQTQIYGALGHVITDVDTNQAIEIKDGEIVKASIVNIRAAQRGSPGEKTGVFQEGEDLAGTIEKNCQFGIFGRLSSIMPVQGSSSKALPIALASQVKPGPAQILTVLEGTTIESFDIEIQRVYNQSRPSDKGMIIEITDERLLEATGGIIQGMSGSPIIQNGRLVGAVTHVFVNDPTRGYGIFLEWMIAESGLLSANDDKNI